MNPSEQGNPVSTPSQNEGSVSPQPGADSNLAQLVGELMARYDAYRGMWIEQFGSDRGFDAWFTRKALPSYSIEFSPGDPR